MSEVSKNEQLIYALLDGELDDLRAQEVRTMLAKDRQLSQCYQSCLAQREAFGSLTRFKLPEDFRDRILRAAPLQAAPIPSDSTAATSADSQQLLGAEPTQPIASTARSGRLKWQIATTAILSSAATLLLSMYVIPAGQTDNGPLVSRSTPHSLRTEMSADSTDPVLSEASDSLLEDEVIGASALAEPPIEQVWLLEAQDNQSGVKLARTLAANSIQVPAELAAERGDELSDTLDQEINGILIEASAIQMKKALLELADSEQFEISAFTLPGHEAYFADIRQAKKTESDLPEKQKEDETEVVPSADQLAAEAIAAAINPVEGQLSQPAITMAQQLRQRRFSKKKTAETVKIGDQEKTLLAEGALADADDQEALGATAASGGGMGQSPAVKQNVDALFPNHLDSGEPKGNYLLLIRSAPQ